MSKRHSEPSPQLALVDDGHVAKLERDRLFDVDRTPGPVCRQGLAWSLRQLRWLPSYMVDVGAGGGVFGQQLEMLEPGLTYKIAIEPREEELANLERHYDRVFHTDLAGFCEKFSSFSIGPIVPERQAMVACNPKFAIFPEIVRYFVPRFHAVLIYGSIAWGCSEEGAELFSAHRPMACGRVIGRVNHRGPGINPASITKDCPNGKPWGADQRDVCWWLWKHGKASPRWSTENLEPLPACDRTWTIPPGHEP